MELTINTRFKKHIAEIIMFAKEEILTAVVKRTLAVVNKSLN